MIQIYEGLFRRLVINAYRVSFKDKFLLSCYSSYLGKKPSFMKIKEGQTILIDLSQPENDILMAFKSNTRNEVRRGIKDGYFYSTNNSIDEFVAFYNSFAKEKSLSPISPSTLKRFNTLIITKAGLDGKTLTMHANIVDVDLKKVSLLYSASVRFDEGIDRKNVGISNRYLHYNELIDFKKQGFAFYDFSGVCEDEKNKVEYTIGLFKKGFGGREVPYKMVYSYPFWFALKIRNIFK